jgi:hypothetical protein
MIIYFRTYNKCHNLLIFRLVVCKIIGPAWRAPVDDVQPVNAADDAALQQFLPADADEPAVVPVIDDIDMPAAVVEGVDDVQPAAQEAAGGVPAGGVPAGAMYHVPYFPNDDEEL